MRHIIVLVIANTFWAASAAASSRRILTSCSGSISRSIGRSGTGCHRIRWSRSRRPATAIYGWEPSKARPASMVSASIRPPCPPGTSRQRSDEPARRKAGADGAASTPHHVCYPPCPARWVSCSVFTSAEAITRACGCLPTINGARSTSLAHHTPRLAPQLKGAPHGASPLAPPLDVVHDRRHRFDSTATGTISGTVHDSTGAVIPGVAVTTRNVATGAPAAS